MICLSRVSKKSLLPSSPRLEVYVGSHSIHWHQLTISNNLPEASIEPPEWMKTDELAMPGRSEKRRKFPSLVSVFVLGDDSQIGSERSCRFLRFLRQPFRIFIQFQSRPHGRISYRPKSSPLDQQQSTHQ